MPKSSLRERTVSGLFWSFSNSILSQIIFFIVGLILARILSPSEFGLIGMITVFLAVSQSLMDSGFGQALIRKTDATGNDYSTVFYYNLAIGLILYFVLFISAPSIAKFYNEPELKKITRVLCLVLIINSFGLIQRTILIKSMKFRQETSIVFISSISSGLVAIFLALKGYGVWSLVWKSLVVTFLQVLLYWSFSKWHPILVFSRNSFRELFSFGSRLMLSGLIETLFRNVYLLIIGKFFSSQDLGYYTKAEQFSNLPSKGITGMVQKVSYPALSQVQNDHNKLKEGYKKIIQSTMFISFFGMMLLAAIAKPLVIVLIGVKWIPSVQYLQLLCFVGMLYPLHALNLNMLNVKGRSDLFLRLEIIKKILAIPVIMAGIFLSISAMIVGMLLLSVISYFINSYYSGRLINYPVREQVIDILPTLLGAALTSGTVFTVSLLLSLTPFKLLVTQIITGIVVTLVFSESSRNSGYTEIKAILAERVFSRFKN